MNRSLSNRDLVAWLRDLLTSETCLYILKRSLQATITLFFASILCFAIIQLSPGNFLDTLKQNPKITPERVEELKQLFGLSDDKNFATLVSQYFKWLLQALQGNLGLSMLYFQPVSLLIGQRIRATLELAIASIILTWAIAIPLGIIGAVNQNKFIDKFLRVLSYTAQGFPSFVTSLSLLIVAQICSPLLPVGGIFSLPAFFGYPPLFAPIL